MQYLLENPHKSPHDGYYTVFFSGINILDLFPHLSNCAFCTYRSYSCQECVNCLRSPSDWVEEFSSNSSVMLGGVE